MYFLGECFLYALGLHVLVSNTLIVVYVMGFFDALMVGWMAAWLAGWVGGGGVGGWIDGWREEWMDVCMRCMAMCCACFSCISVL